ncbi:MAG TPA: 4-hydroxyphenylacetate 3-hydroxylase N-terminal domain-containing protein [Bradyrhizobium sp.]|nr:4-hydroxyphenylacetate 3-hydroxylase N-terminal domain-containing protein [Bradyrhizobium sp.]
MQDGRTVYIGSERVGDVTIHPAFAGGAKAVAEFYDLKAAPEYRDQLTYEENGARHSIWWLRPRSRDDLSRRTRGHKALADMSFGFFGRSPDHIGSLVTGLAMKPTVLESLREGCGDNLMRYYERVRDEDIYLTYAVTPPSGLRSSEATPGTRRDQPSLRVVREEPDGVVISGMKMLATAAVYADEMWIGNLQPLDESRLAESITCAIPIATPGLALWARQPYALHTRDPLDYPLSYRFDETDCVLVCQEVKIPWQNIFLHDNAAKSRAIYLETPANCLSNHQSNCRFWAKMSLIVGLASRACIVNGVDKIPAVREQLGRLAALEATIGALVHGQLDACESWPDGYASPNRRMMYAALNWCQEHHTEIVDVLRTLMGGVPLQMPADSTVLDDAGLREVFERWWGTAVIDANDRMKLYKLGWDITGSEFAGRHQLYEKFYAGHSALVRASCDREAPWDQFHASVDRAVAAASADSAVLKRAAYRAG